MILKSYTFEGAAYQHELLLELIEDLGGWTISKKVLAQECTITFTIPERDASLIRDLILQLQAGFRESPLLGTEIAVVSPTIARHHLPHVLCDVAEFARRMGAKNNMIGLARGVGQRIAQITTRERKLIEEHDVAIIVLGNFKHCIINYKGKLFSDLSIPFVVTGGPELSQEELDDLGIKYYVSGIGRLPFRFTLLSQIDKLDEIIVAVTKCLEERRKEIANDPLLISPFAIKDEIERQLPEYAKIYSPAPIVPRLNGVRVKLPYSKFKEKLGEIKLGDYKLKELARIKSSVWKEYSIIEILTQSEAKYLKILDG
ncbi:MAG: methyl-coenzyme M reductase family protein [Candidatus Helarchaeota archaeon]